MIRWRTIKSYVYIKERASINVYSLSKRKLLEHNSIKRLGGCNLSMQGCNVVASFERGSCKALNITKI